MQEKDRDEGTKSGQDMGWKNWDHTGKKGENKSCGNKNTKGGQENGNTHP